ncbi:hypothetical protein V2H45_02510 [Tumidithrix elongata RA019]|uniref:Uncharacterized protein n=1 Tax=Tumidithrix elongata BACA0141 TaxID=2716417 RepID=A0AAW9PXH9_9CYAN|nr:hypothetical protein [Tumidithrix elongata RA019]
MHISKAQKIDQQQSYPCPCPRKRGTLQPITLTDALGCDRCSLIFVVEEGGYSLVQLGGIDPYRRAWQWVGSKWQPSRGSTAKHPLDPPVSMMLASMALLVILLAINSGSPPSLLVVSILLTLLILITWWVLVLRRRDF